MAYVYRHIRIDKNVPFYIGIGKDDKGDYTRASSIKCRNRHWKRITAKTAYDIEIISDGISWSEACKKETEFIQLYGRRDLKKGPLVNLTDGGEGFENLIITDEQKKKMSVAGKNRKPPSAETRAKLSQISKERGITKEMREKMAAKLRGRPQPEWQRKILSAAAMGKKVPWSEKPILQYGLDGQFIKEFRSGTEASKELGITRANIGASLSRKNRQAAGFIFRHKTGEIETQIPQLDNSKKLGGRAGIKKIINIQTGTIYNSTKKAAELEEIPFVRLKNMLTGSSKNRSNLRYL